MRRSIIVLTCLAVALTVGGCGGGDDSKDNGGGKGRNEGQSGPPAKTADPPTVFNANAGVLLPKGAFRANLAGSIVSPFTTLHGRTAYIVSPVGLTAVDVITGKQQWNTVIEGAPSDPNAQSGPFVNPVGPKPPVVAGNTVVAAVATAEPGKGTTPGHQAIAVVAVDTKSGKTKWTTKITVPETVAGTDGQGFVTTVVGVSDKAVVVNYKKGKTFTVAIDPSNQRNLWTKENFDAGSVNGDVVVGAVGIEGTSEVSAHSQTVAVGLTDGNQRWTATPLSSSITITAANSALVVVDAKDQKSGDPSLYFLDPASGAERGKYTIDGNYAIWQYGECNYDEQSVLLCNSKNGELVAFDATTGKQLWKLPDPAANRVAPSVTSVWHGAVYGRTQNGPLVLDAKTGQDRSTEPGIVPRFVSEYAGIAADQQGNPVAYPVLK